MTVAKLARSDGFGLIFGGHWFVVLIDVFLEKKKRKVNIGKKEKLLFFSFFRCSLFNFVSWVNLLLVVTPTRRQLVFSESKARPLSSIYTHTHACRDGPVVSGGPRNAPSIFFFGAASRRRRFRIDVDVVIVILSCRFPSPASRFAQVQRIQEIGHIEQNP